jgi:glycogen debranching enzyme
MARYNPIGYHNGTIWPHDTVIAAEGFLRYGHTTAARRLLIGLIEAAMRMPRHRLPELFAGSARYRDGAPLSYPDANAPQAWAASATLRACELLGQMRGLDRGKTALRGQREQPPAPPRGRLPIATARIEG